MGNLECSNNNVIINDTLYQNYSRKVFAEQKFCQAQPSYLCITEILHFEETKVFASVVYKGHHIFSVTSNTYRSKLTICGIKKYGHNIM